MNWKVQNDTQRGYNFHYDDLNRITAADYQNNDTNSNKNYSTSYAYDKMGNIKNLTRNGLSSKPSTFGVIDDLTLNYNGNQLSSVTDASTSEPSYSGAFNFVKASSGTPEYTYDANGNLTRDSHKKIAKIQYNLLNLPSGLQFTEGHTSEYLYDAAGVKRKVKQVTTTENLLVPMGSMLPVPADKVAVTTQTDYCGNVIYENGVLSRILVDDGYITMSGTKPIYHYYIQDHQGNNRVVFNQSGTIEQTNHYYPFGMTFGEGIDNSDNRYKYNGKELDRMHGLDLYDYGARHYDAAIGRWGVVDPLAEKYYSISPYAYCNNNPVKFVDPDGRKIEGFYLNKQGAVCYNKNATKDAVTIANAMMRTDVGETTLKKLVNAKYPVTLNIQEGKSKNNPILLGHTETYTKKLIDPDTKKIISKEISSVNITLFKEKLQEMVDTYSGMANGTKEMKNPDESDKLYKQLVPSLEDMITTVATHEGTHGSQKNANSSFVSDDKAEQSAQEAEIKSINQLIKKKNERK